ncbi:MAG: tRNA pseudouridine(38-40) synthase TruA [Steroidobacteraceae bacterium]|nr:tRNA pseudouridine(38-40) synthase TruA [Steroidobacteraceae bacterium]
MPRIALGIEYDGSAYAGWQHQAHARGVQGELERALAGVAGHEVSLTAAGRTDAGVHALMQVAHFDTQVDRPEHAWSLGGTAGSSDDVTVLWARAVPDHFHARYSALSRTYVYRILNRRMRPALERLRACWVRRPLDAERMELAAQCLVGEHDFSSFRAAECQSKSPMRRLDEISVDRCGDQVEIAVRANAFLHHMVRNIAGSLLLVGGGDRSEAWLAEVLAACDRTQAGPTAPPQGLYFAGVEYPAGFALPCQPRGSGRLGAGPRGVPT